MIDHIAIIGLGSIGRRHLRILKEMHPEIEVTLVRSGKGGDWEEEKLANRTVNSIDDAVQGNIQAAIIATPASLHLVQAKELVSTGVHILVEKPLSHLSTGISELLKAAAEARVVGLMGYCLRFDPGARKFKKMLNENLIGQLLHVRVECGSYLPDWRPSQDYRHSVSVSTELGGGVLLELSHELDYIRWFFGNVTGVFARLHNSGTLGVQVEECADLILTSHENLPISMHLDFNRRHAKRRCIVNGTNGELTWDSIKKQVIWHPANATEKLEQFVYEHDHNYQEQLQHFLDCIENDNSPTVTLEDGAAALRLVEAAKKSHKTGQKITLL